MDSDSDPFQCNQAFRPSSSLSENLTLWCLIQGDCQAFKVTPPLYIDVDDLKRFIHASIESTVPAKDLILWKLRESEPLEPDDTFTRRVSLKFSNLSEVATKLGPSLKLSTLFFQKSPEDCLHIIVQMPSWTNSDNLAIPLPVSPLTQVPSKRSSSTSPENDLPPKKLRNGQYILDTSSSDFIGLAEDGAFVDKSLALQEFLEDRTPLHLLLRPRRSGKTILLEMFRNFFESATPDQQARRKATFKNLTIGGYPRFDEEFGKYPVLYLDFSNVDGSTMEELLSSFKTEIRDTVLQLEDAGFFQNRSNLAPNLREFLKEIIEDTLPDQYWPTALSKLTEVLDFLHKTPVIVLMDEYDSPMSYAAQRPYFTEANRFFRKVFSKLLKNNKHLRGALLVGILHVAKGGWFSGLNNIKVFPLGQSERYSTACMFTEKETRTLYNQRCGQLEKNLPFEFGDLEKWYNGYSTKDGAKLFNPFSISNALTEGNLEPHWVKSGYDTSILTRIAELLRCDDAFRGQCQTLLNGDEIIISTNAILSYTIMSKEQLWTLMYFAGYLTIVSRISMDSVSVRIPNVEITSQFRGWIKEDFDCRMTKELSNPSVNLFRAMTDGNFKDFATLFGSFLLESVPQRIFGSVEMVYQDYLFAYFSSAAEALAIKPKWNTVMETAAGTGRTDMAFWNKTRGTIDEVKHIEYPEKRGYRDSHERKFLTKAAKEALEQCDTRHYRAIMPATVTTVCEYGLAFLGPYCGIEARLLERVGEKWVIKEMYTAEEDEVRRKDTYFSRVTSL